MTSSLRGPVRSPARNVPPGSRTMPAASLASSPVRAVAPSIAAQAATSAGGESSAIAHAERTSRGYFFSAIFLWICAASFAVNLLTCCAFALARSGSGVMASAAFSSAAATVT